MSDENNTIPTEDLLFTGFPPSGSKLCPRCDYSLEGLPAEHACPECGLRYDRYTCVWRPTGSLRSLMIKTAFLSVGVLLITYFVIGGQGLVPLVIAIAFAMLLYGPYLARQQTVVSVTPSGILQKAPLRAESLIHYDEIIDIRMTNDYEKTRQVELMLGSLGDQSRRKWTPMYIPTSSYSSLTMFIEVTRIQKSRSTPEAADQAGVS